MTNLVFSSLFSVDRKNLQECVNVCKKYGVECNIILRVGAVRKLCRFRVYASDIWHLDSETAKKFQQELAAASDSENIYLDASISDY